VFTGDTLLIGGTGRTDLPSGDPEALYDSLFGGVLKLDPALHGLPGARLQGPQPLHDRAGAPKTRGCRSASAMPSSR
jgi:glyoxylase-like metal-dependent hydrolase (beta-lactamase superfamily II)